MSRTSRALSGTLTSFLQFGLQIVFQVALAPIVLRVAGQETLGAYAILMQALGYLSLMDLGFSRAVSRFLPQAHGYNDDGVRFRDILCTFRTFALFSNLVYAAVCVVLSVWIGPLLHFSPALEFQSRLGLYSIAVWAIIRTPLVVYGPALIATQNLSAANLINTLGNLVRLVGALALVALGFGLLGLILAYVFAEFLGMSLQGWTFIRRYPRVKLSWNMPAPGLFREMFVFGAQASLISISWLLTTQTDNLVVGYLYGAAAASIYYTTQMPATLMHLTVTRLAANSTPAINELYARKMTESLQRSYLQLHRFTWLLILPAAIGMVFLYKPMISLWVGVGQYAGNSMAIALAIFAICISVEHCNFSFVMATGRIRVLSTLSISEGVMNLILSLIMGKYLGLPGVMWATVIANLQTGAYLQWRSQRIVEISWSDYANRVLTRLIWPSTIGFALLFILSWQIKINTWLMLFTQIFIFVVVYISSCYRFSIDDTERLFIKNYIRTLLGKS
jgi:O-antigen/teichoic acid export membrane protein